MLQKKEKTYGRPIVYTFNERNGDQKSRDSFMGYQLHKELETNQREEKLRKIHRKEKAIYEAFQEEENVKQRNERNRMRKAGDPNNDYGLRDELTNNYQSYCRYEQGLANRQEYTLKNSLLIKQFLKNKKNQFKLNKS